MIVDRIRKRLSFQNQSMYTNTGDPQPIGDFKNYIGKHKGENFIVCGCGNSLNTLGETDNNILIGVNDVGRKIDPDYLVVVNSIPNFKLRRWEHVVSSNADAIFTHLKDLPMEHSERKVLINLGKFEGVDINNFGFIDYTTNSPYMAAIIAYQMGARKIGLIGVDFTPNHFFDKTGVHQINRDIDNVLRQYKNLADAFVQNGVKIANLSQESMVESWPKMSYQEFETI
jgi:hypothetical protein